MQEVDRLGWAATTAFRVGPWAIGVRSNTLELDGLLRSALAAHVLDRVEAPRNYSIAVHRDDQRGIRPLDALWWQYSTLHQSRSAHRVVRSLLGHLGDHADVGETPVRVGAVTLVGPGGAVVADPSLGSRRSRLLPLLRKLRLQVVDSRWADIDDAGHLVVAPPPLDVDESVLEFLAAGERREPTGPDRPVAPGRYPIRGWIVRPSATGTEPSRAWALSKVVSQSVDVPAGQAQRTLDALASSIAEVSVGSFRPADVGAAEAMLRELIA